MSAPEEAEAEAPDEFVDSARASEEEAADEAAAQDDEILFTDEAAPGTNRYQKRGEDPDATIAPPSAPADPDATIAPAAGPPKLAPPRAPASAAPPPLVLARPASSADVPGRLATPPAEVPGRLAAASSGKLKAIGSPVGPSPQSGASGRHAALGASGKQAALPASPPKQPPQQPLGASGKQAALAGSGTSKGLPRPGQRPERSREEDAAAIEALDARTAPAPGADPFVGKDLGPFRVTAFVGAERGERRYKGVGNDGTQRLVLLRVFPQTAAQAGPWVEEFKRVAERADRACRVEAPNLDSALAAGKARDAFYAVFEPPLGPTLQEVLAEGPLEEAEVLQVVEQVSRGLQALHQRDLVHGHVSPAVIRRPRPGTFVLEAAGLARTAPALAFLAHGGEVLGAPGFIAPEALEGEPRPAADLYALGCVAWTALCQRPPFAGEDDGKVALDQLQQDVPAPTRPVSPATQAIIAKLCGRHPDVRYKDVKDLVADLRARERNETIQPFPPYVKPAVATLRAARRLQGSFLATVILVLLDLLLLGLVVSTAKRVSESTMPDPLEGFEVPLK